MGNGNIQQIFNSIDQIIKGIDATRKEPKFSSEVEKRKHRISVIQNDNFIMERLSKMIAYSQGAKSDLVSIMLEKGIFDNIFHNYEIDKVSIMNPSIVLTDHWDKIKSIRFKKKVNSIIDCAKAMVQIRSKYGSFAVLLGNIPVKLTSDDDIEKFWKGLDRIKAILKEENMPFFKNYTSMLHLLLDLGYDCIKPDSAVMKASKKLGIVSSEKGENNLLITVKFVQRYCISRKMIPSVIDFYLLIYGGQRWAKNYVNQSFYKN